MIKATSPRGLIAALPLLLLGCDDTIFESHGGDGEVTGEGFEGVQEIVEASCLTGCHEAAVAQAGLDLETDLCGALVDVTAASCGTTLVASGDSAGSLLWQKMDGSQTCGTFMPLSGLLDAATVEIVANWIDDGAACE